MKYIVKFRFRGRHFNSRTMYMIRNGRWTSTLSEATIHNNHDDALAAVITQYPSTHKVWHRKYIVILKYTAQEYFKELLKG